MAKEIPKQLFIIKDVFSHGKGHAYFDTKVDRRLAIISFHNSIELFLRYALNRKATSNDELDNMKFRQKLDEFENKLSINQNISYSSKIMDLNDLRNKIYHDYRIPTKDETEESKVITNLFLEEFTKKIFHINFKDISLFDLNIVKNPYVKDAYIEGLNRFSEHDYKSSMRHFKHAFNEQWNSVYGNPKRVEFNIQNPKNDPAIDSIVSSINTLTLNIEVILKNVYKFSVDKHHLEVKDWIDTVYHGSASENVSLEDISKIKKLLEEFIAETDDNILKDYLDSRISAYESLKQAQKQVENWL